MRLYPAFTTLLFLPCCAPSAHELQARARDVQLDSMQAQLTRTDAKLQELANDLTLLSTERNAAGAGDDENSADSAARRRLQVVRLQPDEVVQDEEEVPELAPAEPPPNRPRRLPRRTDDRAADLFHRALLAYQRGAAQNAYASFDTFIKQFPNHREADSARFWMGICKFENGAYDDAIAQFTRLRQGFPRSNKTAEALLKIGLAHERLQQPDQAHQAFAQLISAYPSSAPAELARARMAPKGYPHAQ